MNEHEIESASFIPSADDQTWLDATPRGESRKVVYRVGEVRKEFIVDRRVVHIESIKVENGVGIEL
jgi:hypothetical protein